MLPVAAKRKAAPCAAAVAQHAKRMRAQHEGLTRRDALRNCRTDLPSITYVALFLDNNCKIFDVRKM